jgi:hypothetical protein
MDQRHNLLIGLSLTLLIGVTACDSGDQIPHAKKTEFPGQITAGGGTSGEVMARASGVSNNRDPSGTPGIPRGAGGNVGGAAMGSTSSGTGGPTGGLHNEDSRRNAKPDTSGGTESVRGQASGGNVSGTPSIPEGAGGNPSGAAMGGTTSGAAASQTAPPPQRPAPGGPVSQGKPADASGTRDASGGAGGNRGGGVAIGDGAPISEGPNGPAATAPSTVAPASGGPASQRKQ